MPILAPVGALSVQVGQTAAQNELSVALGLSTGIAEAADRVRVNRRQALAVAERVKGITGAIASAIQLGGPPTQAGSQEALEFEALERVLKDVHETLASQGQHSYLSQLVHQQRDREKLAQLSDRIDTAYDIIMIQLRARLSATTVALESQLDDLVARHRKQIQELPELEMEPETTASPPPNPALHLGRDSELEAVVESITDDKCLGRVAILGGPGMGKTTLAAAALHHSSVKRRFGFRRYFVACDAAEGQPNPFRLVAEAFGAVASDQQSARQHLHRVLREKRTLLVLDNFESAWETPFQREGAESLLQFLGSIKALSLIVTMRGAERPQGIQWSQPLLPPLSPLSESAAKQTFLSIADCGDSESALDALLHHVENVPLALVLLANLAQCETVEMLLRRWQELNTAMLIRGNGQTRLTSLDVSIRLSLHSARVEADGNARDLLSLLSLLPCGAVDGDIAQWGFNGSARTVSVLLRTSLATRLGHRIYTLAPIRSFMLAHYPPRDGGLTAVYQQYFGQVEATHEAMRSRIDPEICASLRPELANIEAIIRHALTQSYVDLESAVKAVARLCLFYQTSRVGPGMDLLPLALEISHREKFERLEADLLRASADFVQNKLLPGDPETLRRQERDLYQRVGDTRSAMLASIALLRNIPLKDAIYEGRRLYAVAEGQQDLEAMARCRLELGLAIGRDQRFAEAITEHNLSIGLSERISVPRSPVAAHIIAANKFHIAEALRQMGDLTAAIPAFHEALGSFRAVQHAQGVVIVCTRLAHIMLGQGHLSEAIAHATSALARDTNRASSEGMALVLIIAYSHGLTGDSSSATRAMERIRDFEPWQGFSPFDEGVILNTRGGLAALCGNYLEAQMLHAAARIVARRHDVVIGGKYMMVIEAAALQGLTAIKCAEGRLSEAAELAIISVATYHAAGSDVNIPTVLVRLAEALDDESADPLLRAVAPGLYRDGSVWDLGIALVRYATVTQHRGDWELAKKRARKALEYFGEIKEERRRAIAQRIIDYQP